MTSERRGNPSHGHKINRVAVAFDFLETSWTLDNARNRNETELRRATIVECRWPWQKQGRRESEPSTLCPTLKEDDETRI
jgi:hypothetical protein